MKKSNTGPVFSFRNTREWSDMPLADQQLVAHQLEKQISSIGNQLALDVTAGLRASGVPAHLEVSYKIVWEPGTDPRGEST